MKSPLRGGYSVTYDDDLNPTITFFPEGRVLTGDEAKRFLKRGAIGLNVMQVLFLPVSALFAVVVGINRATEWILEKVFNG